MNSLYRNIVRPIAFRFDPEHAHRLATAYMRIITEVPGIKALFRKTLARKFGNLSSTVAGIRFPGPVGMGAGFDKNGLLYPSLAAMGFDFIESGTFTAHPQEGNPLPRIFRYPKYSALVNRMGFNNPGVDIVRKDLASQKRSVPRGINIGKSKVAPLEFASLDYLQSLRTVGEFGDYITVNVSSPNTPGLRTLQKKEHIAGLLRDLRSASLEIPGTPIFADPESTWAKKDSGRPLFVKVAPDLNMDELFAIVDAAVESDLDGIIISNTTLDHSIIPSRIDESGGLSGKPLREKSTAMIRDVFEYAGGRLAIIGVGGIFSAEDAMEKILAGASLIQIYTGYIYEGPTLPQRIRSGLNRYCQSSGKNLTQLVGSLKT